MKFEILNPKHETISKSKCSNIPNRSVLDICILVIWICFGFNDREFDVEK